MQNSFPNKSHSLVINKPFLHLIESYVCRHKIERTSRILSVLAKWPFSIAKWYREACVSLSLYNIYIYIHVEQIHPLAQPFIRSNALRRDLLSVQIFSVTADEIWMDIRRRVHFKSSDKSATELTTGGLKRRWRERVRESSAVSTASANG